MFCFIAQKYMQWFNGNHLRLYKIHIRSKYTHFKIHAQKATQWEMGNFTCDVLFVKSKDKNQRWKLKAHRKLFWEVW